MTNRLREFWRYQSPAIGWGMLIFIASSVPSSKIPSLFILSYDKVIHGIIFFVLGVLVYRAIAPRVTPMVFVGGRVLASIGGVVFYGMLDEFHQSFVPGRTMDVKDLCADAVGGLLAALYIYLYSRRQKPLGSRRRS